MKRHYFTIFIFIFFINNIYSQNGWQNQRFVGCFYSVNFSNEDTGYLLDFSFRLYKTINSGNNWFYIQTNLYPLSYDVNSISFLNNNTGYVCGDYAKIFKTIDGGYNWLITNIPGYNFVYLYDIKFIDTSIGFAAGYHYIFKTTDSGNNWQPIYSPGSDLKCIYFINSNTGYFSGFGGCYKTTNAGDNWSYYSFQNDINFNKMYFINTNTGYGVGLNTIAKTTNGGENWFRQYPDSAYTFESVWFTNEFTGYASGRNGILVKTSNAGINWIKQNLSISDNLTSIFFTNNLTGFICGVNYNRGNGCILKTTNGGVSMKKISSEVPDKFILLQNYPNPFNPSTNIKFLIKEKNFVTLKIFDIIGKEISTLVNENLQAGEFEVNWDARHGWSSTELPSGVYYYMLTAGDYKEVKKMVLVK